MVASSILDVAAMIGKKQALAMILAGAGLCVQMACQQVSDTDGSLDKGVGSFFARTTPTPPPISSGQLRSAAKSLAKRITTQVATRELTSPATVRGKFMETVFLQIISEGGMPRWQVRSLIANIIDDDRALCGGAACGKVFGIRQNEIEDYLDEMLSVVQKDPRLRDKDHQKTFQTLVASLESDLKVARKGKPTSRVSFSSEAVASAVQKARPGPENLTFGDLDQVTHIEIKRIRNQPFKLDELVMFPNLKSISFHVWDMEDLNELVRVAHLVEEIEIVHPFISVAQAVRLSDLEILADFTRFKSVSLVDIKIDDPDLLARTFPRVRSLRIDNFFRSSEQISDSILRSIAQMPYLRRLSLGIHGVDRVQKLSFVVPKTVADIRVEFSPRGLRDCGTLSLFKIFRNASSFKVSHCGLSGIGNFGVDVAWKILNLDRPYNTVNFGDNLKIKLGPELKDLAAFESNTKNIQLDDVSQHELAVRLALSQKP
jgi:hypothetical protein